MLRFAQLISQLSIKFQVYSILSLEENDDPLRAVHIAKWLLNCKYTRETRTSMSRGSSQNRSKNSESDETTAEEQLRAIICNQLESNSEEKQHHTKNGNKRTNAAPCTRQRATIHSRTRSLARSLACEM